MALSVPTAMATASATVVPLCSQNLPMAVQYPIKAMGHVRFYLAPEIEDEQLGDEQLGDEELEDET